MDSIRLYVARQSPKTKDAVENLINFLDKNMHARYELKIVDLLETPAAAVDDDVFVTPTMIWSSPKQSKKIVGDIGDPEKIFKLLGGL